MKATDTPKYEECTRCNLCLLPCPVWRRTNDPMLCAYGRVRGLQADTSSQELKDSIMACALCGACAPACPMGLDTIGMTLDLRTQLAERNGSPLADRIESSEPSASDKESPAAGRGATVFLPGASLRADDSRLKQSVSRLESAGALSVAADDGADIVAALEAGRPLAPDRQARFTRSLAGAREIIAAEGLLHRCLRQWVPRARIIGLGEALLRIPEVRAALEPTDMYVLETRCYHADHKRLVDFYDQLQRTADCAMNVDLTRIAIPTTAASLQSRFGLNAIDPSEQAAWILEGRTINRVVVEDLCDLEPFEKAAQLPVIHISELADEDRPA